MQKKALLTIPLLALAMLVLSPAASQASPDRIPPGIYVTYVTPADVPADYPPDVAAALPGTWEMEITGSGVYVVHKDGQFVVFGRYVSNESRFILHDELGPLSCSGAGQATGIYDWSFDGEDLTLTLVHDNCGVRAVAATAHPFELQQ